MSAKPENQRINARLDEEIASKVSFLKEATNLNETDIIRLAIELYYQSVKDNQAAPYGIMSKYQFIGAGKATKHLSSDYKKLYAKELKKKV